MIICTVLYWDDTRWQPVKRASVTGYECSMFHCHVSDVDVTRCEIHTTRRVSCHRDSWMKCIHSCEQHGAYMSLQSCHHQCTVSLSVSSCVCVCVTERLQLDFYCIFSHTNRQKGNFEIMKEVHEDKLANKLICDFSRELMIFNKTPKQLCLTHSFKKMLLRTSALGPFNQLSSDWLPIYMFSMMSQRARSKACRITCTFAGLIIWNFWPCLTYMTEKRNNKYPL